MKKRQNLTGIIIKSSVLLVILAFFIFLIVMKSNSDFCENWTRSFAQWYQYSIGNVFKYLSWSMTEIFFVVIVGVGVTLFVFIIIRLVKHQWLKAVTHFLTIALIAICTLTLYQSTAEMAYNRAPVPITLYEEKVEKSQFDEIVNYYIDDMNKCASQLTFLDSGEVDMPYTLGEMGVKLAEEYKRLNDPYFNQYTTYVKPMMSSFIYREFHITGVTFTPLTEANINFLSTNVLKPFTYAHELAHTKGVMRENDANLVSAYLLLTSDDPFFRYSGYYYTVSSLLTLMDYSDTEGAYSNAVKRITDSFFDNNDFNRDYWNAHQKGLEFAEWINNIYLKMSGVKDGTASYQETPAVIDKDKEEIIYFSTYQKLFFQLYFNK